MRIRVRHYDYKAREAQPADSQAVIVAVFAVSTARYMDCRPVFRILRRTIESLLGRNMKEESML